MVTDAIDLKKMYWHSRRGMLELDLILAPFVENVYDSLEENDKLRFQVLLECEDQSLFMWFMKRDDPLESDMQRIVQIIRDSRRSA